MFSLTKLWLDSKEVPESGRDCDFSIIFPVKMLTWKCCIFLSSSFALSSVHLLLSASLVLQVVISSGHLLQSTLLNEIQGK